MVNILYQLISHLAIFKIVNISHKISSGILQQTNSLKLIPYFAIAKTTECVAKTNFHSPDFVITLDFVLRSHLW